MSYKDSLKKSQGGNTTFLKLPVTKTYKIKEQSEGSDAFANYVKEGDDGHNEFTPTLAGILIGTAMKMEVFDAGYGTNGGTYNTTHYFSKQDEVAIFNPKGELESKMTAQAAEDNLKLHGNVKKRSCLFLASEEGLIEVQSNVTLTIEQQKNMKKNNADVFLDKIILLTPAVYKPSQWSKDVQKVFKIAAKNPPKYAEITVTADITEELAESVHVVELSEQFVKWKNQIQGKEDLENLPAPSTIQNVYKEVGANEPPDDLILDPMPNDPF